MRVRGGACGGPRPAQPAPMVRRPPGTAAQHGPRGAGRTSRRSRACRKRDPTRDATSSSGIANRDVRGLLGVDRATAPAVLEAAVVCDLLEAVGERRARRYPRSGIEDESRAHAPD